MSPLWIVLVGVVIVVGGILALRLHAFLALVLAALAVAALTPRQAVREFWLGEFEIEVAHRDDDAGRYTLKFKPSDGAAPGLQLWLMRRAAPDQPYSKAGELVIDRIEAGKAVAVMAAGSRGQTVEKDDLIVHPLRVAAASQRSRQIAPQRVVEGFGGTAGKIAILIAMASIIGKCLLESGAADRIVRSALNVFGERGAPVAFVLSGFLLGVPVFFDTVFYLMIPLGKALALRTGRNYLLYVLTIVCGATMAHSLVPPTPGPLIVCDQLNVDVGLMMLAGSLVGLVAATFGFFYAHLANRWWSLPLRESADLSLADLEQLSQRPDEELPKLWLSLLPILLPVVLIGGYTVLKRFEELPDGFMQVAATLGDKNIALILAAAIAMGLLVAKRRTSLKDLAAAVQLALASGGVIILITAAGGAFGNVLKQTGIAGLLRDVDGGSPAIMITIAFFITTAVRTAQGSATVAMVTAAGILANLADPATLGCHPVYLALAIGCGSKPIAWMNDSGFWVICKMSGMTEVEGLKYITPLSAAMGLSGLLVTILAATIWPMV